MAFTYEIDAALGLVRLHAGEELPTLTEFEQVLDRLASDPLFRPGIGVLVERRHLDVEPDATYVRGGIDAIARRSAQFGATRWASLTLHLSSYGMGRMAEAFAENRGVAYRVFMNEAEALKWLLEQSGDVA